MRLSKILINAIKTCEERQYKLAHRCDMHPSTVSQLLNGIYRVKPNDWRVVRLANALSIDPTQAFEQDAEERDEPMAQARVPA